MHSIPLENGARPNTARKKEKKESCGAAYADPYAGDVIGKSTSRKLAHFISTS
jgi:hypothetical protein